MDLLRFELLRTAWPPDAYGCLYLPFNAAEALAWFACAWWVQRRWWRSGRRAWDEPCYALAFLAFGLSDLRELVSLPMWLLALKGLILIALIALRRRIRPRYPGARL